MNSVTHLSQYSDGMILAHKDELQEAPGVRDDVCGDKSKHSRSGEETGVLSRFSILRLCFGLGLVILVNWFSGDALFDFKRRPDLGLPGVAETRSHYTYDVTKCPGYRVDSVRHTLSGLTVSLALAGPECNAFGKDNHHLLLSVTYETESRLHVHIYDKAESHFQIPESVLRSPGGTIAATASDFEFKYESDPFGFYVVRKRTGEVIFDTRPSNIPTYSWSLNPLEGTASNSTAMPAHPLIFSDQYLQISSALPHNASIYGLGEYYSGNYRRNPSHTVQPFWALDIGDPIDANMYGYHSVYQEVRPRKAHSRVEINKSNVSLPVDTHAVWLKTSAGMDVILRDGVIQYRAIGGTLDFYFYSGDERSSQEPTKSNVEFDHAANPHFDSQSVVSKARFHRSFSNSAVTVIEQYVQSIGLPQIPPAWAFGYHQCKWGYSSISELRDVVSSMSNANIPLETMWSDIDWMHAYRNFESDPVHFSPAEFKAFISELHQSHQHYIPIIDAAISVQVPNGTDIYDPAVRGVEMGVFITNPETEKGPYHGGGANSTLVKEYVGIVWPGYSYFPDWWAESTQSWWTEAFKNMSMFINFDGIWLDMNEPTSFCKGSCGTGADWNNLPPSVAPTAAYGWPEGYDNFTFGDSGNITVNGTWTFNPNMTQGLKARSLSFAPEDDAPFTASSVGTVNNGSPDGRLLNTPPYAIHNAHGSIDSTTVAADAGTKLGPVYDVKNLWGFSQEILTHRSLLTLKSRTRPFLVSRSTFAGSGKYTSHWLGDNASTWRYLWYSLQGVFQFQLFGIPMVGADACGFAQNTDEELCNRWIAMAAWHPFFRNHNILHALPQEPYRWDSVAGVSRKVLGARYKLLPLWQTLLSRASERGTPVIRTLWQEFPGRGYESADRQFLVGDSLLVTPVLLPNVTTVDGVFPYAGGLWRDFWTHEALNVEPDVNSTVPAPLSHINVHIRPGTVLALYKNSAYTTFETAQSPYTLIISLDNAGEAHGEMYYDDGETQWVDKAPGTTVTFDVSDGKLNTNVMHGAYSIPQNLTDIVILGVSKKPGNVYSDFDSVEHYYDSAKTALNITSLDADLNKPFSFLWT